MKILLIEPKSPAYNVFSYFKLPLLGLPILGAILKKEGHDVKINVENFSNSNYFGIKPDFVGISILTSTANRGYEIADYFRSKGAKVMIGGPHATFMPHETLEHADYVIRGEGEWVIKDVINGRHQKGIIEGRQVKNLDELPFPDLSLMKKAEKGLAKKIFEIFDRYAEITPIYTSRGCPYDCTFCSVTKMFGRNYRFRSAEGVMEEIIMKKPNRIFFYDDNFTANPTRTKKLLELLLYEKEKTGRKIKWTAQTRVDIAKDEELLDLMKGTDCTHLYIGFESVNPATLKKYNKRQDVEDIEFCIKKLHEYGIKIHGMFVLGSDDDTAKTVKETLDFSERNRIDTIQFMILTPLPGTQTYNELEKEGRIITKEWSLYDAHHAVFHPKNFTASELEEKTMKAMKEFYSLKRGMNLLLQKNFTNAVYRFIGNYFTGKWKKSGVPSASCI